MQIMSSATKALATIIGTLFIVTAAASAPVVTEKMLSDYRSFFKTSAYPIKYIFVGSRGENKDQTCCESGKNEKVYVLNISGRPVSKLIYSPEINRFIHDHFEVTIDNESIISSPGTDYAVVTMTRPHEYNPTSTRCAAGMGEDKAILVAITDAKISVVERNFLGCGASFRQIRTGEQLGYEVQQPSTGASSPQLTEFMLKNGRLVRRVTSVRKEVP